MKLFFMLMLLLSGCASTDHEFDADSYRVGCYDAVYNYILKRDELTEDSLPDSLYASDYCRFMQERRGL